MQQYKKDFIDLLVRTKALKFGEFTLKSGRKCPYFINMGEFYRAGDYVELADAYAQAIHQNVRDFDVIFGPAYKGIPLATGTAASYYLRYQQSINYTFNRKEAKDHGEKGVLVGAPITKDSKVVIVDDVTTAGTAIRESMTLFSTLGDPQVAGVVLACDRMERGQGEKSTIQELKDEYGIDVYSIVNLDEIVEHLRGDLSDEQLKAIDAYREEYGA